MGVAVLAGGGVLPGLLAQAGADLVVTFAGAPQPDLGAAAPKVISARFEQFGALFEALRADGISTVCMAGALSRPALDPAQMDAETRTLVPRIMAALGQGDDELLRLVLTIFEEQGFRVVGAHQLRPDLIVGPGVLAGAVPDDRQAADIARARAVLDALGPLDVGQGAIAAKGQVLGIETLQGTDAMLTFVGATRPGSGGVLVKRPKPGQELRVDMPAIGTETIKAAAAAGLSGIEIAAGKVLVLDPDAVIGAARTLGLGLWAAT